MGLRWLGGVDTRDGLAPAFIDLGLGLRMFKSIMLSFLLDHSAFSGVFKQKTTGQEKSLMAR